MASDNEAFCVSDPNFAVICSFLECFGKSCGIDYPDIATLQKMLEDTHEVPQPLVDLHIKLLRKTRKSVSSEKWERALVKFCHTYSNQDGWELERFGYKKARIGVKLRLLKVLLESQFDLNQKFKNEVNKLAAKELRVEPLGRDKTGLSYWFQLDEGCNIRVYREDLDEESWELVANDREGVVNLINTLSDGEIGAIPINEDSNSLEISEKPIIDTGQVTTSSPSLDEDGGGGGEGGPAQENGDTSDSKNQIQLNNKNVNNKIIDKSLQKQIRKKIANESDNSDEESDDEDEDEEEDAEDEEELSNEEEEVSKHNTEEDGEEEDDDEEDESQDTEGDDEGTIEVTAVAVAVKSKAPVNQLKKQIRDVDSTKRQTVVANEPDNVEKEMIKTSVIKPIIQECMPVKSIETPVITTSPLKLVNIAELKHTTNDQVSNMTIATPVSIIKSAPIDDSMSPTIKMHEKITTKNSLPFNNPIVSHSKFPIKPIDQLAANLVRMQSEKLEKPSASKLLEKIAENLARSSGAHGSSVINGDDDKFLPDFSARNQPEKLNLIGNVRNSRGIDLSTSPRGWEGANDHNRPVDFSGIDLSSRKTTITAKPTDLLSPGYRSQEFQYREMDLSTRKVTKTELPNLPYDSRTAMLRNHTMVTDLSKRQMPFVNYDMPSVAAAGYHGGARIPGKEEHRLANYAILPDPSKLASMRNIAVKRTLESAEDPQQEMMKRIRADLMRGAIEKKSTMVGGMRRNDVGPAIEEPLMMVHGEGSGSDCDAGNPEIGDTIEEPVIFFYGEGSGRECETGNPGDETSTDNKNSNESKSEGCSEISGTLSQTEVTEDDTSDTQKNEQLETTSNLANAITKSMQINSDCIDGNTTMTTSNCQFSDIATTSECAKMKFKPSLGVQVIAKTSTGPPIKRFSRWDVGAPEEKRECDSSIISNEKNISTESSIDYAECCSKENTSNLSPDLPPAESKSEVDAITSTTYQNSSQNDPPSTLSRPEDNKLSANSEFQCDSSSTAPMQVESMIQEEVAGSTVETKSGETSHSGETDEAPRFFFGPNCVSYTPTTFGKGSLEPDATSSSSSSSSSLIIHSAISDAKENICTMVNNDCIQNSGVPATVSELVLAKADDGSSEEANCDNDKRTESALPGTGVMDVSVDEESSDKGNNKEVSNDLELRMSEDEDRSKENVGEMENRSEDQPNTTVENEVPDSSIVSSNYPEDERGDEDKMEASTTINDEIHDDTVTNSECEEVEKSDINIPDVTAIVESTILTNEVGSTSTIDDNFEDESAKTNVETIDSSSVEKVKIDSIESLNVGDEEDNSKTESEEAASQSIISEVPEETEDVNIRSSETEQEHKVESSVGNAALHIATVQNPMTTENIEEKHQSCDTSALEPTSESIPIQDSSAEAAPSAVPDSSDPESTATTKVLSEEEFEIEELQKVVDSTDTFCEDFSDTRSSSVDQDSNEPMVIDDRTTDSIESTKNSLTQSVEKFQDALSEILDSNISETNKIAEDSTSEITTESLHPASVIVAPTAVSTEVSKPEEMSDTVGEPISKEKESKMTENIIVPIDEESALLSEQLNEPSELPSVDGSILVEKCPKPSLISQASLVANYDSNESNDTCLDDVFDTESGMETDSQNVEEPMTISIKDSQVPAAFPENNEVLESAPTTSTEITPAIDTMIVESIPSDQIKSEKDNNIFEKVGKTVEKIVVEVVKESISEEKSVATTIETVDESSMKKLVVEHSDQEPCDAGEVEEDLTVENRDTKIVSDQPATDIIEEAVPETPETQSNELGISEPPKNMDQAEPLLPTSPPKIASAEEINRTNPENISEEITEHIRASGSEYSGSNSPAYTDEDDDDGEPPIIQVSKRARTDIEEFNQKVLDKPTCLNVISKDERLLNETQNKCGYNVPNTIVTPMVKSDNSLRTLQIGENPEIDMSDNISRVPFVKDNVETKVEMSVCENLPSMSMKKSLEEFNPKFNLNVMTTITESVQEDKNTESSGYIKCDMIKETSKRLYHEIESEDLQLLKSKSIDVDNVKDKPQPLMNDIKSASDEKPIEVIDKTLNPSIESIIALTSPVLQLVEKKEFQVKNEEISLVCSNNISETKQSECELVQDTIVITDLSNAKPVEEHGEYSDDSMGVDNECMFESTENNVDPLLIASDDLTEEKMDLGNTETKLGARVKSMDEMQYEGWKLDSTEPMIPTPKISRKRRNSSHESNSEDCAAKLGDELEEMTSGKRMKLRGKRTPDMTLRKSVEDSRVEGGSSEDETPAVAELIPSTISNPPSPINEVKKEVAETTAVDQFKPKSKAKGGRRRRGFRSKRRASHHKKSDAMSSVAEAPNLAADSTPIDDASESTPTARKKRKKRKMVLGLEIGIDIALPDSQSAGGALDETPVRQSRRIAQIKIKEQADRRRIEEEALGEMKEKKDRDVADKKKRKKIKNESDDDPPVKLEVREEKEVKLKKKRKKRKKEAKFNEAKPWQSSSGSSTEVEDHNDEDLDDEDDIESEESLLFKSDHEFSPESDLEKDAETEPMRRARTAQKLQNDIEEAEDEYACQKCGKADHPEWILLCDTCDKGWHCSCLRPALMLIPEGDWFCPPCQHTLLVNKLRDSLKTYDQLAKRHENEILRKKRLAFVGISLDNVLQKNDAHRHHRSSRLSSRADDDSDEDNDGDDDDDDDDDAASKGGSSSSSESSDSGSSESGSSSDESEPVYQLRERRCANTYKFNEYDDMINAAIRDEVEAVQGAGNQGRGKDISTIVNAEKDETQVETFEKQTEEEIDEEKQSEKESDKELSRDADITDDEEQHKSLSGKKLLSRKKHRKLNSLDISSEDDPDSDEDFKGSSSDDDEDYDDQLLSSDDDSFTESRRRGKKNSRPVRRSTRAARKTRYDEDFINDDSDDSDRPKRKKSKSTWDESESEESDNSWRSCKKKSRPSAIPRFRGSVKSKSKKKKKRKRIIEPDNQSDNENEEDEVVVGPTIANVEEKTKLEEVECPQEPELIDEPVKDLVPIVEQSVPIPELSESPSDDNEQNKVVADEEIKDEQDNLEVPLVEESKPEFTSHHPLPTSVVVEREVEKKNERTPRQKKTPTMRRKIIYGGLPDDRSQQEEEEPLGRRTRGRKINYQVDTIMSDSEEELKKALRKTEESEDEFVVHDGDEVHDEVDKDSDSGDIYSPKKDAPKGRYKSPKNRRMKRSPGGKSMTDNGEPKQRKKPGPKPGSKNKPRQPKNMMSSLEGGVIGDVAEGSLASLGTGELAELDDEQLEQMMMEDEEYGRRQLELAAIEIAKNKKKEEREAKKLEKARLKALEILAAEQQRDPNAPEGTDGEAPKKKKRGRRSKAEILADQMRRDGAPHLGGGLTPSPNIPTIVSPVHSLVNPVLPTMPVLMMPSDPPLERPPPAEGQMPLISGPDGHLFNPDGTPMKPKRRGRGKGRKTLALEAARAAEAAAKAAAEAGGLGLTGAEVNSDLKHDIPNVLPTPGSSTSGSAPSTPPAIAVSSQGLPPPSQSSNPQSVYPQLPPSQQSSVITRMLQSQPVSTAPQSFTAAAAAMGQKYFGVPNAASQMMGGPRPTYDMSPRGRIPSPYNSRQPGQPPPMPPHFAAVRSGTPPMRMRVPGPTQLYHTPHHPMDPSPSGGGPISISSRDRASPLGPGPAMIPPAAGSPLAKGGPTPPPYVRGGPPLSRFADNSQLGSRHQLPPFTSASPANHSLQQPSPPPNRPPGNFSPYHPQPPPNYHYGAYPPPAPMPTADDAVAYQGSPYSAEHFSTPAENPPPIQPPTSQPQAPPPPPPPSSAQQHPTPHPNEPVHGPGKQYDEEGSGEFGGLVSYFSSQREDDLDS